MWKDIEGYEGLYQVSDEGEVKSLNYRSHKGVEKILKSGNERYLRVVLYRDGKTKNHSVHRLVALHFIYNHDSKEQVNHINGVKTDNRVENLEWCTQHENMRHAFDNGLNKSTENNSFKTNHPDKGKFGKNNRLSKKVYQFTLFHEFIREWDSMSDIQREFGIYQANISQCCNGKRNSAGGFIWKHKVT